jgi:RNA polymerase sigma factor (sigma-70 family)
VNRDHFGAGGPVAISYENRRERFTEMYDAYAGAVLAYARRRVALPEDAEDAMVDTFTVAWRRFDEMPEEAFPWLLGVARRVVANERRSQRSRSALVEKLANLSPGEGTLAAAGLPGMSAEILGAMQALGEWEREALLLVHWEGFANREAAVVMGCPPPLFSLRVHRARRRLARELGRSAVGIHPSVPEATAKECP